MATYVVGDIQGCYQSLVFALDQCDFDPAVDQLWCAGDLINRGPDSLSVLRLLRELGPAVVAVLGNHDMHLLALAAGNTRHAEQSNLTKVLDAPDCAELIDWLQQRPLLHWDTQLDFAMLHAGIPPQWTMAEAAIRAAEVETVLRGPQAAAYFADLYGHEPRAWSDDLTGMPRWRYITNSFTRLRFCTAAGSLALHEKGAPGSQADPQNQPWFSHPNRASVDTRIVCGHWSTLGFYTDQHVWAIDTGCVWGKHLTLLRIDQAQPTAVHYPAQPN